MGCCPEAPAIKVSDGVSSPNAGQESDIQPGESVECYAARAGDQTGKMDDAVENPKDKIENTSIPIKASDVSVNVTFRLTSDSTRTPTSWTLIRNGSPWNVSGVNFTSNGSTATLIGTFTTDLDTSIEVLLVASDGSQIDARTFKFSPSKATNTNSIKLTLPLPGGIVNSKFGPRLHPISKVMKLHRGIDLKMINRSTVDVVSAADGTVTFAGVNGTLTSGYGNCIKIKHTNGSSVDLCSTLYGHLAKINVAVGQKVAAGQIIGHEGTTGSSTGNHLHFECILPNGTPVDPVPFFSGSTEVSDTTSATGEGGPTAAIAGGSALTKSEVDARTSGCPASGVDPQTGAVAPQPSDTPNGAPSSDPFEKAWYFTMTFEVGPHWMTTPAFSPGDPELDAGEIDTDVQRKKVGYKPGPLFPGGETKFGVAQNPNKGTVVVKTLKYEEAKNFGKAGYWDTGGSTKCSNKAPLIGIMLFDLNYLHGPGNARKILADSGQSSVSASATHSEQLTACEAIAAASQKFIDGLNPQYQKGWRARATNRLAYVKSLPYPLT